MSEPMFYYLEDAEFVCCPACGFEYYIPTGIPVGKLVRECRNCGFDPYTDYYCESCGSAFSEESITVNEEGVDICPICHAEIQIDNEEEDDEEILDT